MLCSWQRLWKELGLLNSTHIYRNPNVSLRLISTPELLFHTETARLKITNDILLVFLGGLEAGLVLEFLAAFETIKQSTLGQCLKNCYGIDGFSLDWLVVIRRIMSNKSSMVYFLRLIPFHGVYLGAFYETSQVYPLYWSSAHSSMLLVMSNMLCVLMIVMYSLCRKAVCCPDHLLHGIVTSSGDIGSQRLKSPVEVGTPPHANVDSK